MIKEWNNLVYFLKGNLWNKDMHAWFQGKWFRIQINNEFMNKNNICCMEQHICILLIENNLSIKLYQKQIFLLIDTLFLM